MLERQLSINCSFDTFMCAVALSFLITWVYSAKVSHRFVCISCNLPPSTRVLLGEWTMCWTHSYASS